MREWLGRGFGAGRARTTSVYRVSLNDLYKEVILDHYQHPRHRGQLENPDVATRGHNPLCGDEIILGLRLGGDRIQEIAFGGRGCSISQASASMMAEAVTGGPIDEALGLGDRFKELMTGDGSADGFGGHEDLEALQGVRKFPVRVKCALLPWTALADAIEKWRSAPNRD